MSTQAHGEAFCELGLEIKDREKARIAMVELQQVLQTKRPPPIPEVELIKVYEFFTRTA